MAVLAIFFHGEQILPILIGALFITVAVLSLISFLLVRGFRRRLGTKAFLLAPIPFVLTIGGMWAFVRAQAPNTGPPFVISAHEAFRLKNALPEYASFSYSGMAYFNDNLYVATNIGLFEIIAGKVAKVCQPQKQDSVVSGPWVDKANHLLWITDDHTQEFLNFDGSNWRRIPMPKPETDSRGLALEGVQPIGNDTGFWIAAGGSAWRWNAVQHRWDIEPQPHHAQMDVVIGVLPVGGKLLFLIRHELLPFLVRDNQFSSDTVMSLNEDGSELAATNSFNFLAETWASTGDAGYICSKNGDLLEVTRTQIRKLDAPNRCETTATTSDGELVVAFRTKGIYSYKGKWNVKTAHPYPSGEGEYWAHLAANKADMAYAVSGKPVVDKARSRDSDMKFTLDAPTELWTLQSGQFHQLRLE